MEITIFEYAYTAFVFIIISTITITWINILKK